MKFSLTIALLLLSYQCFAQNQITAAEYFIDEDPGIGNGNVVEISPAASISFDFEVPVTGVPNGIHTLHTRVKNSAGRWSLYSYESFYIVSFSFENELIAAEYFLDEDPGIGEGTALPVSPGENMIENFAIPIDDLEPGIHLLYLRTQNAQDKWSLFSRETFYIMPEQMDHDIVAAEYFIDTDPGIGNGVPIIISAGAEVSESIDVTTADTLMEGDHFFYLRVLNSADKWSLYSKNVFIVDSEVGIATEKVQFELFPNPTHDLLYLKTTGDPIVSVRVIDLNGKLVLTTTASDGAIDMSQLPAGSYLVQVVNVTGAGVSKQIIRQ